MVPTQPDLTFETWVYPADADLVRESSSFGWDGFFVKDYVKSLNTSIGSLIRDPTQIDLVVAKRSEYRGEIEGGICISRFEDFVAGTERRHFVIKGRPCAADPSEPIPDAVRTCAERIPNPFCSVAIRRRN